MLRIWLFQTDVRRTTYKLDFSSYIDGSANSIGSKSVFSRQRPALPRQHAPSTNAVQIAPPFPTMATEAPLFVTAPLRKQSSNECCSMLFHQQSHPHWRLSVRLTGALLVLGVSTPLSLSQRGVQYKRKAWSMEFLSAVPRLPSTAKTRPLRPSLFEANASEHR